MKLNNYRAIELGDLGVGGERGIVHSPYGLCPCESATQYKDPIKIIIGGTYAKKDKILQEPSSRNY